jgi:hypothetical protein
MLPASVPPPKDDAITRTHLIANVQAAAAGDLHPGDWRLHSLFLVSARGVRPPDYAELHEGPLGQLLGYLGEGVLGHAQLIAQREMEAGQ